MLSYTTVKRTNIVRLLPDKETTGALKTLGDRASALWNVANYLCRQMFIKGEPVPGYSRLCALMKDNPDYRSLPTHIGQEVLKKLSKAWASYFRLRKLHGAGKLKDKPRPPRYRKDRKKGTRPRDFIPVKSTAAYGVEGNVLYLAVPKDIGGKRLGIPFKGIIRYRGDFKTCELVYENTNQVWYAHLIVELPDKELATKPVKHAAGDIGARRTITISTQDNPMSVVYSSRAAWKDYKYWTRLIAREKSRLATQGLKTSRHLQGLYQKRRLRLRHTMEALASDMAAGLRRNRVTHFTVGYPVNCRDNARFGKGNELVHNFWSYKLLLDILEKHCARWGIVFEKVNERGTSSHCHICGRKVTRPRTNLVVCPVHGPMHADVNASRNILKKKTQPLGWDGEKASPAWTVKRWDSHRWRSHAESAEHRVLQPAA